MKQIVFFTYLASMSLAFGQNEAGTCFFGNVGVDFRHANPQIIFPINMVSKESPASICDSAGTILFYTNGGNSPTVLNVTGAVWNANHSIMDNGILGDSSGCLSSYQGSIIVPFPSGDQKTNANLYYLFTRDCLESSFTAQPYNSGLTYAVIDMNQNGGLGKVVQKNVPVVPYSIATSHMTAHEPVSAIIHGNETDYWLFSYTNDSLYRMKITELGITNFTSLVPGKDKISISPNRDFLCSGNTVYQFDPFTGAISFWGIADQINELTFSPDGSKLYGIENSSLYQFDVTQSNFPASKTLIASLNQSYRLFLAPNHKIYLFEQNDTDFAGQIRCPNSSANLCEFSMLPTSLGGGNTGSDCTNIMAHYLYYSGSCTADIEEESTDIFFQVTPNPAGKWVRISTNSTPAVVEIMNLCGATVYSEELIGNELSINTELFPRGTYFIKLSTHGNYQVKRLILESQ